MPPVYPRGPAAGDHLPSTHPSNPYHFPEKLAYAGRLPPKVTPEYVFFFGYEGEDPHVCFQQWFPCVFKAKRGTSNEMVDFPTTEHYMMYHKALLMNDLEVAEKILIAPHPSTAKKLGREVRNFDLDVWKENADRIVEEGNYAKFTQNEDLKQVLLQTSDRVIVEASPDDKIWGIGFNSEDAEGKEQEWGNNGLGKALMKVRERIRQESS